MGGHSKSPPRGYIVRIETKQGCVYRPKTLSEMLERSPRGGLDATARRLVASTPGNKWRFPTAPRLEQPATALHAYPQGKGRRKSGGSGSMGPPHPRFGDDSIEVDIDLARSDLPLPGEHRLANGQQATEVRQKIDQADAASDAELIRRGILYSYGTNEATGSSTSAEATATPSALYQADSLDGIQHEEPAYTVRLVDSMKRKGKRGLAADGFVNVRPVQLESEEPAQIEGEPAQQIKELPVPEGLRLFAFGNLWEEENSDAADGEDTPGRLLGHEGISLEDIENVEYVLIEDDDLHSMAASWVELESVSALEDSP